MKTAAAAAIERQKDGPLFLRKTFAMIESCTTESPALASWSADGTSFYIKSAVPFASQIIPKFFRHSKLSSFVRQLNFYGFKKVKAASNSAASAEWAEFKHPQFLRDSPHLLAQIARTTHVVTTTGAVAGAAGGMTLERHAVQRNTQEVLQLKSEVTGLKARLQSMTESVAELSGLVQQLVISRKQQHHQQQPTTAVVGEEDAGDAEDAEVAHLAKKRKAQPLSADGRAFGTAVAATAATAAATAAADAADSAATTTGAGSMYTVTPPPPSTNNWHEAMVTELPYSGMSIGDGGSKTGSGCGIASRSDIQGELIIPTLSIDGSFDFDGPAAGAPLLDDEALDALLLEPEPATAVAEPTPTVAATPVPGPFPASSTASDAAMQRGISMLPPELQDRFLDKLAAAVANTMSVAAPPAPPAEPQQQHSHMQKHILGNDTPAIALPLASAALGAFLTKHQSQLSAQAALQYVPEMAMKLEHASSTSTNLTA